MIRPCVDHACDGCGWCSGSLNNGVPVCCLAVTSADGEPAPSTADARVDRLHQAIVTDQATQPILTDLIRQDVEMTRVPSALTPDPVPLISKPERPKPETSIDLEVRPAALPAPSRSLADLLIPTINERKENIHGITRPDHA